MAGKKSQENLSSDANQADQKTGCQHEQLLEDAPVGIFTTTSSGQVLSINQTMARILGFAPEETGRSYYTDLGS